MKKILTATILSFSAAFAALPVPNLPGISGGDTSSKTVEEIKKTKKTYETLVNALKTSNNADHALYLGVLYLNGSSDPDEEGKTLPENLELAKKYILKAINLGNYKAAALLGTLYLFDDRFRKEENAVEKARYYLTLAVKNEVWDATVALSSLYFYYDKDTDKGLTVLHLGAKHGVAAAQLALATLYGYGSKDLDIPQNKFLGNQYIEKACTNPKQPQKVKDFCNSKSVIHLDKKKTEGK